MKFKIGLLSAVMAIFLAGLAPAAEKYTIDNVHSYVGFSVSYLVLSSVKGNFGDFEGMIHYDENDLTQSSVEVSVKTASIDTDNPDRDNHLRNEDFFSAPEYPEITFKSDKITKADDGYVLHGDLTMRGVTKAVEIPFEMRGKITDPRGNERIAFEGSTKINRKDFGVNWNKTMDTGGVVVGDEVEIDLQIQAIKAGK